MSDVFERRPSALKPESDGFARLPSAGKQVQWADDADLAAESPSKGKDGFWSPKARGHTAASSATQKSRAETAIDVLFGDQASPRTERAQLHERVPTAAARRQPWSRGVVDGDDERSVVFCGHRLSVEDFVRARGAKTGMLEEYNMSQDFVPGSQPGQGHDADGPTCNSPLFSPAVESPLTQRRGARLQRRISRAQGLPVDNGSSSEDELDFSQLEFNILKEDAAEAQIDESALSSALQDNAPSFSRVSSTESAKSVELKKRKKKKHGHAARAGDEIERVGSAESTASAASSSFRGAANRVKNSLRFARASSGSSTIQRRQSGGMENVPRDLTGEMKIAALLKDMTVEKVVAADESIQLSHNDDLMKKTYEVDLEGADEVQDVVQVLEEFAEREESRKYLTLLLGRTGFGADLQLVSPPFRKLSTITALALNACLSHSAYIDALVDQQPAGIELSNIFHSMLAPASMTCLTELTLADNFLRADGAMQLQPILKHNSLLTALDLSNNDLFCRGLPPIVDALSTVCTHLRSLNLSANWIGCEGMAALGPVFDANTSLLELDLGQNGIAALGCLHLSHSMQKGSMSKLMELRIPQNRIDEQAQKVLFPAITTSSSLGTLNGLEGGTLGVFYEYVVGKIVAVQKHIPQPSSEFVTSLDLSRAELNSFPMVLLELKFLESLDVSYNSLPHMPYIELCALSRLTQLDCNGNPNLMYPDQNVIDQGGEKVMSFIRDAMRDGCFNISVLLIPVGEVESGKTCLIQALSSPEKYYNPPKYLPTIAPDMSFWTPEGQEGVLEIRVVDTSGSIVYAITHEFFTAASSIFLFVWRLEKQNNRDDEEMRKSLDAIVYRWISKLHFSTPGATVLAVATHVDTVETESVNMQNEAVQKSIKRHVFNLNQAHPAGKELKVLNDAKSMCVGSIKGFGVQGLQDIIVEESKRVWLWGHPLSEQFRALTSSLHTEKARTHSVDLHWKEFKSLVVSAGFDFGEDFRLAMRLLHDLHYIRYFGDIANAWNASDEELSADGLLGTVYIDIEWCAGAFRGLIRHQRDALLKYFGGRVKGHKTKDQAMLNLSKRIAIEGILHQGLCPFMWPEVSKSKAFWDLIRNGTFGKIEQDLWQGNIAESVEDYMQIQNLMCSFGVMTRVSVDEFFVPYMKANSHRRTIDARAVTYADCPYLHNFAYKGTPEHFFWRLSVSLASTFKNNQIGLNLSAHYNRGTKVVLSFSEEDNEHTIIVRSTHRREVEAVKSCIAALETKYPGLRRVKRANMDRDTIVSLEPDQAVQIFISHSSDGHDESEKLKAALMTLDPNLQIFTSHTHRNDSKHIPNTRVFIPLIDNRYHRSQRCVNEFNDACAQGCSILSLILHSFEFPKSEDGKSDYLTWWPRILSGMKAHSLFINFAFKRARDMIDDKTMILQEMTSAGSSIAPAKLQLAVAQEEFENDYKAKVEKEVYASVIKILDRWRCSAPPNEPEPQGFEEIACKSCLNLWNTDPGIFSRVTCLQKIDEWRIEEQVRRGSQDKTFSDPYLSCKYGHGQIAMGLVADEDGFESMLCMSCVQRNSFPITSFNYLQLTSGFKDRTIYARDEFECPLCAAIEDPKVTGQLTILDIIQPEVFISFFHGYLKDPNDPTEVTPAMTQVKDMADMIKRETDILSWVSQRPPQNDEDKRKHWIHTLRAIKEIPYLLLDTYLASQCKLFVVILSDAYCNTKSCRREFEHAVQSGKFMIPVLIPEFDEDDGDDIPEEHENKTGWMGPVTPEFLASDNWWNHAVRVSNLQVHEANVPIQWSILKYFEPISLHERKNPEDQKALDDVYWKIIERLWGGHVVDHQGKRNYNEWKGARQNIMSELNKLSNKEDADLSRIEQMEARAVRLFNQLDTDGNGILDEMELKVGLELLGVDCSNTSMVSCKSPRCIVLDAMSLPLSQDCFTCFPLSPARLLCMHNMNVSMCVLMSFRF